jgi:OPA family glycerol-3-phosphate transporter-like MFS transporter
MITAVVCVFVFLFVRETPEEAGFPGEGSPPEASHGFAERASLKEAFLTITRHRLVWFYALAYACTGAVRHGADHMAVLYFVDELRLDRQNDAVQITLQIIPIVAVFGSIFAGLISDRLFRGRRAPVAMALYFLETAVIVSAILFIWYWNFQGTFTSCLFLILISFTANSTHSIVGTAAPMDIGGRRMAGFAAGVIDSFQYFGSGIALPTMGWLLDRYGWIAWFPTMAAFGLLGGAAMWCVTKRHSRVMGR